MKAIKSVLLFGRALLPDFEAMEKADDLSAEIDDFKEALENHFDGCDVLQIKTEPGDFEAPSVKTYQVLI